ncbi:hypothetical protein LOZ51_003296 [Ophidiomyces ophidiicola]|nr:hypothetical protein LOZ51_003296 [Ophidiomyces ophidiicola]
MQFETMVRNTNYSGHFDTCRGQDIMEIRVQMWFWGLQKLRNRSTPKCLLTAIVPTGKTCDMGRFARRISR